MRDYLFRFLPSRLRWRFTDEFDFDVELLSSLELMLLKKTVSVNSWLNCNVFSIRSNLMPTSRIILRIEIGNKNTTESFS